MNELVQHMIITLIIVHCLMNFRVKAQDGQQLDEPEPQVPNPIHPSVPVIIGILSVMFSLTFVLCAYAKFCHNPLTSTNNHQRDLGGLIRTRSRFSGIDKTAIESLPFFRFSSLKGSKEGLECAVCISKFEESEVLRLLPKCRHAFHMSCIDQWLESHASCPLCRYKFDHRDLRSLTYSNSLRYVGNNSNLSRDLNLEIFVQREQDQGQESSSSSFSSRFISNLRISSFRKLEKGKGQESLIDRESNKLLHKFNHKIIVSDVVIKSRWSDVNSSDMLLLSSEMLSDTSSKRFSNDQRFSVEEQTAKVKEDMERKRVFESKFSANSSLPSSSTINVVEDDKPITRTLNPDERRSMSEITNVSRFGTKSTRIKESVYGDDERTRRVWLPIAKRTIRWFAGRERMGSHEVIESIRGPSNV